MARNVLHDRTKFDRLWFRRLAPSHLAKAQLLRRPLRIEPLEDRRLLAIVVNTLVDEGDGSIVDGDVSLRDAIALAPAGDTISFAPALTSGGPATIQLTNLGELAINKNLTINGPGAGWLTIRAFDQSLNVGDGTRPFRVDDGSAALSTVVLSGLTFTGGDVFDDGGGILSAENLTLAACTVTGNVAGNDGGGIYSPTGFLTVNNCTISNNSARGHGGGGVVKAGTLTVTGSTISGNTVSGGSLQFGGGMIVGRGTVNISNSTVAGNSCAGNAGGLYLAYGTISIIGSTISGNTAGTSGGGAVISQSTVTINSSSVSGNSASYYGGGLYSLNGTLTVANSTISGNSAGRVGGGIADPKSAVTIRFSTITRNQATPGYGSGIASDGTFQGHTDIRSSIIAGNVNSDVDFVFGFNNSFQSMGYNLIGSGNATGAFSQTGDQTGVVNPLLDALANNGGPTKTHALLPGSPAIDAGDLLAMAGISGVPLYDQRGFAFNRVVNGRIDIGAFERGATSADFDGDLDVDGADFLIWQRGLGTPAPNALTSQGDADDDKDVDGNDLTVWKMQFASAPPVVVASESAQASALATQTTPADALMMPPRILTSDLVDAAMATTFAVRSTASERDAWRAEALRHRAPPIVQAARLVSVFAASSATSPERRLLADLAGADGKDNVARAENRDERPSANELSESVECENSSVFWDCQ